MTAATITTTRDQEICFSGYVLDRYCIDRGVLLDNRHIASLAQPYRHSFHCLVDIDRCVANGYELLYEQPQITSATTTTTTTMTTDPTYCRAFQLDDTGNQLLLDLARPQGEQGYCETCTGPPGSLSRGFRATVYGIPDNNNHNPPRLAVTRVKASNSRQNSGCSNEYVPQHLNCNSGAYLPYIAAHGSLMLASWGFLLPLGILSARLLPKNKHGIVEDSHNSSTPTQSQPRQLWFQVHRLVQPLGIGLAWAGWITALVGPFHVLGGGVMTDAQFYHAVLGTMVMIVGGFLQPLNAYWRPHATTATAEGNKEEEQEQVSDKNSMEENIDDDDDGHIEENRPDNNNPHATDTDDETSAKPANAKPVNATQRRMYWEYLHKGMGYSCAVVAGVNCVIGVLLSGKYQESFVTALIVAWASLAAYVLVLLVVQRRWCGWS